MHAVRKHRIHIGSSLQGAASFAWESMLLHAYVVCVVCVGCARIKAIRRWVLWWGLQGLLCSGELFSREREERSPARRVLRAALAPFVQ